MSPKASSKSSLQNFALKRKNIRFQPEALTMALIDCDVESRKFDPQVSGLVFSESFSGCGLVLLNSEVVSVGQKFKIRVGKLAPILAEIVWAHEVDSDVSKVGVRYIG